MASQTNLVVAITLQFIIMTVTRPDFGLITVTFLCTWLSIGVVRTVDKYVDNC